MTPSTIIRSENVKRHMRSRAPEQPGPDATPNLTSWNILPSFRGRKFPGSPSQVGRSRTRSSVRQNMLEEMSDTQTTNVNEMRMAFRKMMQPEELTQGDTQPQKELLQTQEFKRPAKERSRAISATEIQELQQPGVTTDTAKPALSQSTVLGLETDKVQLKKQAHRLSESTRKRSKGHTNIVFCQCGHSKREDDMVSLPLPGFLQPHLRRDTSGPVRYV